MPTSSDLVTDLPADFETFGQAVATSMADLLGGTSGQVLSKASNTDMDFTWVTSDDANAIQNTIVDAKGDLIGATAADTPARLAVGSNGESLVADSSTSTGLRWQGNYAAAKNVVLNAAAQIWQRGTSVTGSTSAFCADRFQAYRNTTGSTFSRQVTGDTTNLPFIQYCIRAQRDNATTATNAIWVSQTLESVNSIPFAGKTITLSFYARRGANYSGASNNLVVTLTSGTGTDQNIFSGFTGSTNVIDSTAALTTTWQRFTFTGTVASTATQLAFYTVYSPVGTAGAADYYEITGQQLEIGSTATAFQTATGTIQGELAACRRYLPAFECRDGAIGYAYAANSALYNFPLDVPSRIAATGLTITAGTTTQAYALNSPSNVTPTFNTASVNNAAVLVTSGLTITAGQASRLTLSGGTFLFTGCEL
jgi:hypothetical protein